MGVRHCTTVPGRNPVRREVMKWEYKGRKLARPDQIIRRLAAWPLMQAAEALLFVAVLIGWGWDDAAQAWRDAP